jgi:cellulose biosynthesis protein BcsQ
VQLAARRHPTERLPKMSRPLREIYAALFLDCPAGISLLSENVLRAADVVIVPLVPTPLSLRMLRQLLDFIAREGWSDLVLLPFFSMVDRRRVLHQELISSARAEFPGILATEVPTAPTSAHERAPRAAGQRAAASEVARVYSQLWLEILRHEARRSRGCGIPCRVAGAQRGSPAPPCRRAAARSDG